MNCGRIFNTGGAAAGSGILSLNGLVASSQFFATGTSGTDFNISSVTATHTFNIPDASTTARGLVTTGSQIFGGDKTFNDKLFIQDGTALLPGLAFSGSTTTGLFKPAGTHLGISVGATEVARFSSSQILAVSHGSVSAPDIAFVGDLTTGIFQSAANHFNVATIGVERFRIDSSGVVRIFNLTPAGVVHNNAGGTLSTSLIVNADIDSSAAISRSKIAAGSANHVVINDGSGLLSSEATLAISRGGTALGTTPTNGQLLIGNGTNYTLATLTGTASQITVTNGAGSITLSTPQNIATSSSPTFAGLTISSFTSGSVIFAGTSGVLSQDNSNFFWNDSTDRLGIGTSSPGTQLDLTRDFSIRATTNASAGSLNDVSTSNTSSIRFSAATEITGLTNVNDGKVVRIINVNSVPIVLRHENTSSTAANRFDLPDQLDVCVYPMAFVEAIYDNTDSRWRVQHTDDVINIPNEFSLYEDWCTGAIAGSYGWVATTNGAGSAAAISATNVRANGVGFIDITKGTTATGRSAIAINATGLFASGGQIYCDMIINVVTALSDGTNTYSVRLGLGDNAAAGDHTDGIYFEYDSTASANWRIKTAAGATRTATNTSTAVAAATWVRLTFIVNSAGTSVEYFINGTSVGTISTNIPSTTAQLCGPSLKIEGTVGTVARVLAVDAYSLRKIFSTQR